MKKKLKYILGVAGIILGSCSLDINQPDVILDQDAIKTVSDANLVVIGAYAQMPSAGPIEISSIISDNTRLASSNRGQGVQIHTWSVNSSTDEASSNWASRFRPILNANKLFEKLGGIKTNTPAEVEELKQYTAEAYAIRAYMHFELLRFYGDYNDLSSNYGIPYVVKSGINTPARLSVEESYNKIEADLLMAYDTMPSIFTDKFRITKDAVRAMLSRLYLYKKDYNNAIKYSSELIETMDLNSKETYADIWSDSDFTEIIFSLDKIPGNGAIGEIFTSSNGDVSFHPSFDLINTVGVNELDVRNEIISTDISNTFVTTTETDKLVVGKYLGTEPNPGLNDIKMFRLSEQYLIRAEAYAHLGMLTEAANDYNTLRNNRIFDYSNVVFNSKDVALTSILEERRIELAFEGHRWFDLRRYEQGISRIDEDIELVPLAKELPATSHIFKYFPIPQDEIFANKSMDQNLGY